MPAIILLTQRTPGSGLFVQVGISSRKMMRIVLPRYYGLSGLGTTAETTDGTPERDGSTFTVASWPGCIPLYQTLGHVPVSDVTFVDTMVTILEGYISYVNAQ